MRLSLRFLFPLLLALGAFAWAAVPLVDAWMTRWYLRDLETRSTFVAQTIREPLSDLLQSTSTGRITGYFNRLTDDERLYAVGLCTRSDSPMIASKSFPAEVKCADVSSFANRERTIATAHGLLFVVVRPTPTEANPAASVFLVHDLAFLASRTEESRRYLFYFFLALSASVRLDHRGDRSALLARVGGGTARVASWRGHPAAFGPSHGAGIEADPARRECVAARPRARLPASGQEPATLDPGDAARDVAR